MCHLPEQDERQGGHLRFEEVGSRVRMLDVEEEGKCPCSKLQRSPQQQQLASRGALYPSSWEGPGTWDPELCFTPRSS